MRLRSGDLVHIEDHDQVRLDALERDVGGSTDLRIGDTAGRALVGEGRRDEPVRQHQFPPAQGGPDALLDKLAAAGHVQQHLAAEGHVVVGVVEEDLADPFADGGAARFADFAGGHVPVLAKGQQSPELRALARAVGAFKGDELASQVREPRVGIR